MTHPDHVRLIQKAGPFTGVWADFGSGEGAFTMALADLGRESITLYSIDKNASRLRVQEGVLETAFPKAAVQFINADFTKALTLPRLDGILMANSLHFIKAQKAFLKKLRKYLKDSGKLVVVEYNVDSGNMWVPYPLSFQSFRELVSDCGFTLPKLSGAVPSTFLHEIYAAYCLIQK